MYPLDKISESETRLGSFFWAADERPKSSTDVFSHPDPTPRPQQVALSAVDNSKDEETDEANKDKKNKRNRKNKKK